MVSGGHARVGPQKTEGSGRSDAAGYRLTELPSEGYQGEVPDWPIQPEASSVELDYWRRAWRTPQAVIWSRPEWAWLIPDVARWVRVSVRCDEPDAPATLLARLPSMKDDIGMSSAGLARMGAKIKADEVAARRSSTPANTSEAPAPQRRLRAVGGGV